MLCSPSLSKGTAAEWSLISPSLTQAVPRDEPGFGAACEGRSLREPQKQLTHGSIPGKVCNSTQPGESASGGVLGRGSLRYKQAQKPFPRGSPLPSSLFMAFRCGRCCFNSPTSPDSQGISPCPSSKLLHMALSSLNIFHLGWQYNPNAVFFHYSLFCISWSVIKLKSHSPLNTLNNCL